MEGQIARLAPGDFPVTDDLTLEPRELAELALKKLAD